MDALYRHLTGANLPVDQPFLNSMCALKPEPRKPKPLLENGPGFPYQPNPDTFADLRRALKDQYYFKRGSFVDPPSAQSGAPLRTAGGRVPLVAVHATPGLGKTALIDYLSDLVWNWQQPESITPRELSIAQVQWIKRCAVVPITFNLPSYSLYTHNAITFFNIFINRELDNIHMI